MEKTALEVCEKVIDLVREDARRLNMDDWRFSQSRTDLTPREYESCGTVACLSGWIATVVDGPGSDRTTSGETIIFPPGQGLWEEGYQLHRRVFLNCPTSVKGTREYLTAALKPFEAFIKSNRKYLASTKIQISLAAKRWWQDGDDIVPSNAIGD